MLQGSVPDLDGGPEPATDREYLIQTYRLLHELRAGLVAVAVALERQNGRVAQLERWQARTVGVLAVVGTLATAALGVGLREVVAALLR